MLWMLPTPHMHLCGHLSCRCVSPQIPHIPRMRLGHRAAPESTSMVCALVDAFPTWSCEPLADRCLVLYPLESTNAIVNDSTTMISTQNRSAKCPSQQNGIILIQIIRSWQSETYVTLKRRFRVALFVPPERVHINFVSNRLERLLTCC